jgi:hypothetical protein
MLNNLPEDMQREIVSRLDRRSSARLRATSKEMKGVVDSMVPRGGSYQKKTGKYQKRFSIKGMAKCARKHASHFMDLDDMKHHAHFGVVEYGTAVYKELKKAYGRNTLFADFRSLTAETTWETYWKDMKRHVPEVTQYADSKKLAKESWQEEVKQKRSFRRRVIRLLKLWAKSDKNYETPLSLARRRTAGYTDEEEAMYKDKLMDAIIVQTSILHPADDPTLEILGTDGKPLSLKQKVNMVVKQCRTMLKKNR